MKQATLRQKRSSKTADSLFQRRLREAGGILLSSLAIYVLIALLTYHQTDPSWSHSNTSHEIQNAAGLTGAWLSDFSYSLLGYMAYVFPFALGLASSVSIGGGLTLWMARVSGILFMAFSGCGLMSLYMTASFFALPMGAGGAIGFFVKQLTVPYLSILGATLMLGAWLLVGVTLLTGLSWFVVFEKAGYRLVKWLTARYAQWRAWFARSSFLSLSLPAVPRSAREERRSSSKPLAEKPLPEKHAVEKIVEKMAEKIVIKEKKLSSLPKKPFTGTLSLDLLDEVPSVRQQGHSVSQLKEVGELVESRLLEFGVDAKVVGVLPGPVVTRFELSLAAGVKVNKITGLAKDLARSLSVVSVRVVEVIPGKAVVGLEIPNIHRELVVLKEILEDPVYMQASSPATLALGKDIQGRPVAVDLTKMPHLLVAGTTGSGKSVGLNAMLLSMLYKATPEELRFILIDPKMLELAVYDGIPHLLTPVVTDMKDAANALRWCVAEMERRYQTLAALGVRNLSGYNQKMPAGEKLPFIVVVIDEFADMIMVVGKKVEELIARIAQKARAAGIHLILATQRPSVDVITGLIKANIPTRIAFQVSSRIDSRTILDQSGAEQLLGHGDMLYLPPGVGVPHRIHGAFVSDEEVHNVTQALRALGAPIYIENIVESSSSRFLGGGEAEEEIDELYDQAVSIVMEAKKVSISFIQRRLKIGYNRAARLVEKMEVEGVVSAVHANGTREVIE